MTLLRAHRSRSLLRGRRFLRRPLGRRGPGGRHPRPWRSRRLGLPRLSHRPTRRAGPAPAAGPGSPNPRHARTAPRSTSAASASRSTPPATSSAPRRSALEHAGEVWVVSGDYKTEPDPTCAPFEPVRCHTFVTESHLRAAGLPLAVAGARCSTRSTPGGAPTRRPARPALLFGYALGKAQRLLAGLDPAIGPILTHGAVERLTRVLPRRPACRCRRRRTRRCRTGRTWPRRHRVAPPSADGSVWAAAVRAAVHRLRLGMDGGARRAAAAGGRPRLHAVRSRRLAQPARRHRRHRAPSASGRRTATPAVLARWLRERGLDAQALETRYEGERRRRDGRGGRDDAGGRARAAAMKAFADLYTALDETTPPRARRSLRWPRYFRTAAAARRGVGGALPERPPPQAARRRRRSCGMGGGGGRRAGLALRGELPRRRRPRRDHHAAAAGLRRPSSDRPLPNGSSDRLLALRGQDDAVQRRELVRRMARARPPRALRLEQAPHRQLPGRCVGAARGAGAGRGERRGRGHHRAPARWAPGSRRRSSSSG